MLGLFSRRKLDRSAAAETLTFLVEYGRGIFRPHECGVYEPFELFELSAFERYVGWLVNPGGEFGFRRSTQPFSEEGHISNLSFPEILVGVETSPELKPLPSIPPPVFCRRWNMQLGTEIIGLRGPVFMKELLCDACRVAHADYGFVAADEDYRAKHFHSVRQSNSEIQQYIGDDPEHGIPGLYWINFFGPMYVEYFGRERLATLANHAETFFSPDGAMCLRFGGRPEESLEPRALDQQQVAIRILGETAFFDIRQPERVLEVPSALLRIHNCHPQGGDED